MNTNQDSVDATKILRSLMDNAGVSSYRTLAQQTGVSRWQIQQLRQGHILHMRLEPLSALSQYFHLSVSEFITLFMGSSATGSSHEPSASTQIEGDRRYEALQAEYDRLQQQMEHQRSQVIEAQIRESLSLMESWMLQWPTAAAAAQRNETISASRLIPLVRPIEALLERWGVRAIATVGDEIPYDPTQHQLMNGTAQPGDPVRVRYVGYWLNDKLLHRAKVSPVNS
ncbi:MAG: helix-turn-helix domain-containing protein [Leptolyngbyaceae bacterium]|nr:helix-turn-helix domain-containing protein [Leptolyngbyaceae bacterium]